MKLELPVGTKVFVPPVVTFWQWFAARWVLRGGWYVVRADGALERVSERQ